MQLWKGLLTCAMLSLALQTGCRDIRNTYMALQWIRPVIPGSSNRLALGQEGETAIYDTGVWGGALFTIDLRSGEWREMVSSGGDQLGYLPMGATVAPAGDAIAYEEYRLPIAKKGRDRSKIMVSDRNGNLPRWLTDSQSMEVGPSYSHDGTKIAFFRASSAPLHYLLPDGWTWDLFMVAPKGGAEQRITDEKMRFKLIYPSSFSPDNKELVFSGCTTVSSTPEDRDCQIYLIGTTEGHRTEQLTRGEPQKIWATFSNDGGEVIFVGISTAAAGGSEYDIWSLSVKNRTLRRITSDGHWKSSPIPTPDGLNVLFMSEPGGATKELWSVSTDGHDLKRVAALEAGDN